MSGRRDGRESDSKRYRSKFDRDPSPKRSRREGKPATERPSGNILSEVANHSDQDRKQNQRLRDALPLEAPPSSKSKTETGPKSKESEKRSLEQHEGMKRSSNPNDGYRPRSYFEHDERGQRHGRGAPTARRDSRDQHSKKTEEKIEAHGSEQKDEEKRQTRRDDNHAWRHDGFYKMERDQQPPRRKRPAFKETKDDVHPQNSEHTRDESVKPAAHLEKGVERKEQREGPFGWERDSNGRESQRGNFLERDRHGGNYRRRERFNGRRGYQQGGDGRVEKWKHDLYEEENRSPIRKNDDEYIAKVEALLAS